LIDSSALLAQRFGLLIGIDSESALDVVREAGRKPGVCNDQQLQLEVDAEGRRLLRELTGDIDELVGHQQPAAEIRDSAAERVESAAVRLESEHPRLAGILGEIMDALGRLGI
jgi:hypothetical protein